MSASIVHRREGFRQQKLVVLPESVVRAARDAPLLSPLLTVAAGFFPRAEGHLVERPQALPEAILILCVAGCGWVRVGRGKAQPVEADSLVFIPAGAPHAYGASETAAWSIHWAHVRGEEAVGYGLLFGLSERNPVLRLPRGVAERVGFAEIHDRLEEDYTFPNLLSATARLRLVMAELHRLRARYPPSERRDPVEDTIGWMREHLEARARLPELAQRVGLSVPRYAALFREKTGYPPIEFFLRMKVQHACRLLDTTALRVEEIAAVVGYEDAFYFSRLFRRIMGKSPRVYRATAKG